MKCVKVLLKDTEKIRRKLINLGAIDKRFKISRDNKYSYIPVTKDLKGFDVVDKKLLKRDKSAGDLREVLKGKLSSDELSLIRKSYDAIGDVAIIEIDKKLLKKKKVIADVFREVHKSIKSVIRKIGGHEGKYRVQKYEVLFGGKNLETLYKENGIIVKLDVSKVYFSPRLAQERLRVAKSVKKNEDVLVMFSGVGVYCFVIARHSKAGEIYGIEINPHAHKYAVESLGLNKSRNVKLFLGDVRKVVPKLKKKFDRIIMPLPASSLKFLDLALNYVKRNGIIHLYFFSDESGAGSVADTIKSKCRCKVLKIVKCGQQSPRIYRWCIDFRVY